MLSMRQRLHLVTVCHKHSMRWRLRLVTIRHKAALAASAGLLLLVPAAVASARTTATGLRQMQCFSPDVRACGKARNLPRPSGVVAFGRSVYVRNGVGSLGSLGVFARNTRTGRLTQQQCVARQVRTCVPGLGLETPSAVAVSPDGRSVYVAAANGRSVGVYARSRTTGKLTTRGSVTGIARPHALAVSPDGRNLYVGGDRLWSFRRAASGALTLTGTVAQAQVTALAVSPDGTTVYAASGGGRHGALAAYAREPDTGALTPETRLDSTTTPGIQQPAQLVATRDAVYLAATVSGAVTRYDPDLRQTGIARGMPTAFGLAVTPTRLYVADRDGIAVLDARLRHLGTSRLAHATGVAAVGRSVYAVSRGRITAFARTDRG